GTIFPQIRDLLDASPVADQATLHLVGEPILYGWVSHYLDETVAIAILSLAATRGRLLVLARTWRGPLLPLRAGVGPALRALGIGTLLGYNFDPLVIVVAFIITARAFSHSVQMITRFDDLVLEGGEPDTRKLAEQTMRELFRPSMLGLYADAGAILCVILTPI